MSKRKNSKSANELETRVDTFLRKAKNHPVIAIIVVSSVIIIGISTVIESLWKIKDAFKTATMVSYATVSLATTNLIAKRIVGDYLGINYTNINVISEDWADLASTGKKEELLVEYSTGDYSRSLALFSTANGTTNRLFYEQGYDADGCFVRYDNRQYFVVSSTDGGSAGYIDIAAYNWDGIGPLQKQFKTTDSLFQGTVFIINDQLYADGNNQRYYLASHNGVFSLNHYKRRLQYPELGQSSHILKLNVANKTLQITYDNDPLFFGPIITNECRVKSPVVMSKNDSIVIDDNLNESRETRVLIDGSNAEWRPGFFSSVVPSAHAESFKIYLSDNYNIWYNIDVKVENTETK